LVPEHLVGGQVDPRPSARAAQVVDDDPVGRLDRVEKLIGDVVQSGRPVGNERGGAGERARGE
jgi:hypothetical protein